MYSDNAFVCDITFGNQKFDWKLQRLNVKAVCGVPVASCAPGMIPCRVLPCRGLQLPEKTHEMLLSHLQPVLAGAKQAVAALNPMLASAVALSGHNA